MKPRELFMENQKKIVWAIDAFSQDQESLKQAETALKGLTSAPASKSAEIYPVYVFNWADMFTFTDTLDNTVSLNLPPIEQIEKVAKEELTKLLKGVSLEGLQAPIILAHENRESGADVVELNRFAEKVEANLICLYTHARKGLKRLTLGSFAESLFLHAKTPVFLLNPKVHPPKEFKHIFVPTDFSKESEFVFHEMVKLAKENSAKITLFHSIIDRINPMISMGAMLFGGNWPSQNTLEKSKVEWARKEGEKLVDYAKTNGVLTQVELDETGEGGVHDHALKKAHDLGADMIALASRSGPVQANLIGSVARQIVRASDLPVWIFHPTKKNIETDKTLTSKECIPTKDPSITIL
jgi:nucleotide-binding universal stress UspA family protein